MQTIHTCLPHHLLTPLSGNIPTHLLQFTRIAFICLSLDLIIFCKSLICGFNFFAAFAFYLLIILQGTLRMQIKVTCLAAKGPVKSLLTTPITPTLCSPHLQQLVFMKLEFWFLIRNYNDK
uniref:Uncharacterized protein n=1 Tax=Opuntia streptacantha TaxID=393608 RepID=A0A7C9AKI2_OPUST